MNGFLGTLRQATSQLLRQPIGSTNGACRQVTGACRQVTGVCRQVTGACRQVTTKAMSLMPSSVQVLTSRLSSSYNPYPNFEKTPETFTSKKLIRYGYKYKYYQGGVLPRPKGAYENIPLRMPKVDPRDRDAWTQKKALFGQNDYIDILGDGTVHPVQLMEGPAWLKGFKGNELQRLVRRLKFQGPVLREVFPTQYHNIRKRIFYLYKKLNRRRHAPFWGGKGSGGRYRRIKFDKF